MTSYKQPSEVVSFIYDFDDVLGLATIATIVATFPVAIVRGGVGALITVSGAPTIGTRSVAVKWAGGDTGKTYLTTLRVTDSLGQTHERDGEIKVVDQGFSVPVGLAGRYMTGDEYVLRYGSQETIRLTDESRANVVDGAKLEQALSDASDFADGYIGTAYAIPLPSTPRVVKSIVGAIARELLHKSRPLPEVKDAADRARTQLKDIASGRMTLPLDVGMTAPTSTGSRTSKTSKDGSKDYRDAVDGYNLNAYPGGGNWRN